MTGTIVSDNIDNKNTNVSTQIDNIFILTSYCIIACLYFNFLKKDIFLYHE